MQYEFDLGVPTISSKTPLMYPGGKTRLWSTFKSYLPDGTTEMVSPFIGGGSLEIRCAAHGIKVTAFDLFEPLVNFWKYFIDDAESLINKVLSVFPLSFEEKKYYFETGLQPNQKNYSGNLYTDLERAALFLCLNKQSFRGWTLSQNQCKGYLEASANPELFEKLKTWNNPNIVVDQSDYRSVIDKYDGTFMYFDPPYVEKEHYYGWKKNQLGFDHHFFCDRISSLKNKWILSYVKHDLVMELYKDYNILELSWAYTIHQNTKPNTELLIMNF